MNSSSNNEEETAEGWLKTLTQFCSRYMMSDRRRNAEQAGVEGDASRDGGGRAFRAFASPELALRVAEKNGLGYSPSLAKASITEKVSLEHRFVLHVSYVAVCFCWYFFFLYFCLSTKT